MRAHEIEVAAAPANIETNILAICPSKLSKLFLEHDNKLAPGPIGSRTKRHADQLHSVLDARLPRRRAAEQRDELAPSHSITSSARTSNVG